ncbi:hypothetical protein PRIPAC_71564, partial [Pristionchus pacificus]|uniref:Uncharacterized protein n=1 Tax=Pristionchus pacificus TaxID=54126 RepID=A0A2A6C7V5_PRIPA
MGTFTHFLLFAMTVAMAMCTFDPAKGYNKKCQWEGYAPFCGNWECGRDEHEVVRCISGYKTLCCHYVPYVQPPNRRGRGRRHAATRKAKCEWIGHAPTCESPACPKGQEKVKISANSTDAEFGSACLSGTKSLCCILCTTAFYLCCRSLCFRLSIRIILIGKCWIGSKTLCCVKIPYIPRARRHAERKAVPHCLLLAVVFLAAAAFDRDHPNQECHWIGTAPWCAGGDCPNGEREVTRASEDPKSDLAHFGADCWFRKQKTLCCRRRRSAVTILLMCTRPIEDRRVTG